MLIVPDTSFLSVRNDLITLNSDFFSESPNNGKYFCISLSNACAMRCFLQTYTKSLIY